MSIGLPVYNGEPFVAAAIESILQQTYTDFELIVCDNASTDGTPEIVRRYGEADPRVRYLRADANAGAAANYNWTVREARGEFFKWIAADDLHGATSIERCVAVLEEASDVVLAYPATVDIDGQGTVVKDWGPMPRATAGSPGERFHDVLWNEKLAFPVFGVIRTEALRRTSLIRGWSGSDYIVLSDLAVLGRFVELPEPLFLHREHDGRSTRSVKDLRARAEWFDTRRSGRWSLPYVQRFVWSVSTAFRLRVWSAVPGTSWSTLRWGAAHWRYLGSEVRAVLLGLLGRR